MTQKIIKNGVIGVLLIMSVYLSISKQNAIKEAKKQTVLLSNSVDSLKIIATRYTEIKAHYDRLYADLNQTKHGLDSLRKRVTKITKSQTASLVKIREDLLFIIDQYDTDLYLFTPSLNTIDSLKF